MKKTILILILLCLFLFIPESEAKTAIKININNNKITISKTLKSGQKIKIKSPAISKNKYLKLVNIGIN